MLPHSTPADIASLAQAEATLHQQLLATRQRAEATRRFVEEIERRIRAQREALGGRAELEAEAAALERAEAEAREML